MLLTLIEMEDGGGRAALPAWAPAAAERVAESYGGRLLRLGRDGEEAETVWQTQPWLWDAVFAACRICARMGLTGETLAELDRSAPRFATVRRGDPPPLRPGPGDGPAALRRPGGPPPGGGGPGPGWERLGLSGPPARRSALRVIAEAADAETAEELCSFYQERIRRMDEKEEK